MQEVTKNALNQVKNILSVKQCPCFAEKEPCLEIYTVRLYIIA